MKNEILKDYLVNNKIDMDKMLDDFYGYVYIIVKNNVSISITNEDIEEIIADSSNLQKISEENEQNNIIKNTLKILKQDDYNIFIMFYYESKTIKEISKILNCSENKIKVILHRVRKIIKKNLEDGGYDYGK